MTTNVKSKIEQLAHDWFAANRDKNDANNKEKKFKEQLQKEIAPTDEIPVVQISDTMKLKLGWQTWQDEEIDAKKLFQTNPELFWQLASIPKTATIAALGEKGAAKLMRTVTKTDFKIEKIKK